jgi:tetratricopeptide (TPR) repeat protein
MAAEQFSAELKGNPHDFDANVETAMLLRHAGKLEEALVQIETALRVRPADAGALYQRASIHSAQGLTEKARQELEALIRDYPDFAEARAALATVYYRLKRKEDGDRERDAGRRVQQEAEKRLDEGRRRTLSRE